MYQIAQLNIAKFIKPADDPVNKGFIDNLDRVNAEAEKSEGFIWRLTTDDGNDAMDFQAFDDPLIAINMSVWKDRDSLFRFVYGNASHLEIMANRRDWFEHMQFYLVLWYVPEGHKPSVEEALQRLEHLKENGPSEHAFTFSTTPAE